MTYTVIRERTMTDTILVEAETPEAAYQAAVNEMYGPDNKPTDKMTTEEQWMWTDVFEGDLEKMPDQGEMPEPVHHVDGD